MSLNLPVADEVLRARASRTTHPVALQLLQSLCSKVTARDFAVDNPYLFKTKTDVVTILSTHKAAHLIPHTCSCAHLMFQRKTQGHCGRCSQCIDRRFAITAAGLPAYDSEADYVSDVFVGSRKEGPEKNMAVDYVRHGIELGQRSESELATIFNAELTRAVRYEPKRSEAAEKLISMHKRHGEVVTRVLQEKIVEHKAKLVEGTLDDTSLLALVIGKKHLEHKSQLAVEPEECGAAKSQGAMKSAFSVQPQNAASAKVEEFLQAFLAAQRQQILAINPVTYRSPYEGLKPEMKVVDFSNAMLAAQLTNKQYDCYSLANEYQRPMNEVEQRMGITRKTIHEHIAAAEKAMKKITLREFRAKTAAKHKHPE